MGFVVDPGSAADPVHRGISDPHSTRTDGRYEQTGGTLSHILTR